MTHTSKASQWLEDTLRPFVSPHTLERIMQTLFCTFVIAASFTTYFAMYAFRKPLAAGVYEGLSVWGVDYKIIAVISQVCGYTLSKFLGIRIVSELKAAYRIKSIVVLIAIAWVALLLFAVTPTPYNVLFLFLNGLPLGMIWGIVFSFVEGRQFTELLGAGLCTSFIVASGVVKAIGRWLVVDLDVSEFWMPFLTGALFIPALILGVVLLSFVPAPSARDQAHRTRRIPMDHQARRHFFISFALGIALTVSIYVCLTIFRDVRDSFAVEIWSALGYADRPRILATSEIPIALGVMAIVGSMFRIKSNRRAFFLNLYLIVFAGLLLLLTTILFRHGGLHPAAWMILNGFSMYLAYIAFHTFLFERWIALFRYQSNIGFLMYIADAFGYLGSITIMFAKNFGPASVSWLSLFIKIAYATAILTIVFGLLCVVYFRRKESQHIATAQIDPAGVSAA
jgi:uncharacterized protein DUF5690